MTIPSHALKTPQVSLQIRLFAVTPIGERWESEALNFLYDSLVGRTVFVTIPNCYQKTRDDCLVANLFLSGTLHDLHIVVE